MKYVLGWIKANPIIVLSILLFAVSIGLLVYVSMARGNFLAEMRTVQSTLDQVRRYQNQTVQIPPERPTDPPRHVQGITINQAAINDLQRVYSRMNREYRQIFDDAVQHNQLTHSQMVEGLFPRSPDAAAVFTAQGQYRNVLQTILGPAGEQGRLPRLNAGMPPTVEQLQDELAKVETEYRANSLMRPDEQLTEAQADELTQRKAERLRRVLLERAMSLNVYAETRFGAPGFPFDVGEWVTASRFPPDEADLTWARLWIGQMKLWIQQDITRVIEETNRVGDSTTNVTNSPIKRLLSIRVVDGAVGIQSQGALRGGTGTGTGTGIPGFLRPTTQPTGEAAPAPALSADRKLPDNFTISPTGRQSNPLYDVWHAHVSMIVDAQQIPQFFNNLTRVNFMTVLSVTVQDVDEYAALREGFVYGPGDAVQMDLVLETVWLRRWTTAMMPSLIKQSLGLTTN